MTGCLLALVIVLVMILIVRCRRGREPLCGGADQHCVCSGNETLVSGRNANLSGQFVAVPQ